MNLKEKTIKGLSWSFIDNIAGSGITFLVGIILARILSPSEFGVIGILSIFLAVSNTIIDCGFSNALVRKIDVTDKDYNTVFYVSVVLGILLFLFNFSLAPFISQYFKQPILIPLTRVLSLVLIINSFSIIPKTIFVKKVDFKSQAVISTVSSLSSGIIGIIMASKDFGVWSLVAQILSRQFIYTLFLWIKSSWFAKKEFSIESLRDLFAFSSKLMVSGVIDTIYTNISQIVIGRVYSANQLGQYTRAQQFQSIFSSNLTSVIQRVTYPILSEIQNDENYLKDIFRRIVKMTMLITFFLMFGLAAISKPLIVNLIGIKWENAANYLFILCLTGSLYPLHSLNLNILQIKGRSDIFLNLEIVKKIIGIVPILMGIYISIGSMLWGILVISVISYILNAYYSGRLIDYNIDEQTKDVLPFFIISFLTSSIVWLISFRFGNKLSVLFIQIFALICITFVLYKISKNQEFLDIYYSLRTKIKKNEKI